MIICFLPEKESRLLSFMALRFTRNSYLEIIFYTRNESVDFTFINEECRNLYSENMGRPVTNTPEIMFRSAIVQSLYDYSDREMEYEARYNIMVKWFIGLNLDDSSYDHSALGRFRDLLGEDKWKKVFFSLLTQIENAGYIKGRTNQ